MRRWWLRRSLRVRLAAWYAGTGNVRKIWWLDRAFGLLLDFL